MTRALDDSSEFDWRVMDRYLAGIATEDDRARIAAHLERHPDLAGRWSELRAALAPVRLDALTGADAARAIADTERRVHELMADERSERSPRRARRFPWGRGGVWAAVGLAAAAVIGVVLYRAAPNGPGRAAPARTYATTTGQVATVRLGDGTAVTLAPRSELRVFGASSRTVELTGEAHFTVTHTAGEPFVVRAGAASARVLGTAFTVRHYRETPRVVVAVSDGKVALSATGARRPPVVLTAGIAGIASDSQIVTTSVVDGMQYAGWMRGYLIFRKAPVAEVLQSLSRWYGYEFRLADSTLASQPVTAAISTKSAAAALSTLGLVLEADVSLRGDTVIVRAKRPEARTPQDRRVRPESSTHVGL